MFVQEYLCKPNFSRFVFPSHISRWEFISTLDFEWSVYTGKRPFRWTVPVCICPCTSSCSADDILDLLYDTVFCIRCNGLLYDRFECHTQDWLSSRHYTTSSMIAALLIIRHGSPLPLWGYYPQTTGILLILSKSQDFVVYISCTRLRSSWNAGVCVSVAYPIFDSLYFSIALWNRNIIVIGINAIAWLVNASFMIYGAFHLTGIYKWLIVSTAATLASQIVWVYIYGTTVNPLLLLRLETKHIGIPHPSHVPRWERGRIIWTLSQLWLSTSFYSVRCSQE